VASGDTRLVPAKASRVSPPVPRDNLGGPCSARAARRAGERIAERDDVRPEARAGAPPRFAAARPRLRARSCCIATPMPAGLSVTPTPASRSAAIFASAVPLAPEITAPAWPMRRPGGALRPAMKPTTGFVTFFPMKRAAHSSPEPPISPMRTMASVSGSASKRVRQSTKSVPFTGSPPMPTAVD
jgi:hypothetical protein